MKLIGYLRVSTDDKGQDPERQKVPILARAARDGHEVAGWVVDEGTSGGIPALDRPRAREAIRLAGQLHARGLVVESVDRWTRAGPRDLAISLYLLETDHRLSLLVADLPEDDFLFELLSNIMAIIAKMNRRRLSEATKSGMARNKALGLSNGGQQPKPELTDTEYHAIEASLATVGLRAAATELSRLRGAWDESDPKKRRQLSVSHSWLSGQLALYRKRTLGLLLQSGVRVPKPSPKGLQEIQDTP